MILRKETFLEKIIAPIPITFLCFLGFMTYIVVYINDLPRPNLSLLTMGIIFLSCLLMFRAKIRSLLYPQNNFTPTKLSILPTPDEAFERKQRQIDGDANYFGMIIFVLSTLYLMFLEVAKFY